MDKKPNAKALLPIVVFLVLYLGCGIYFEYVAPAEGQMGFYVVSVVVAFVIALVVAFLQNRSLSFDEKIHVCARGIGDDNIVIMLFIFLMAGAFSGIASAAGGAESTANLLLDILPAQAAIPGLFVIACIISLAMGTSVGTITVLTPIAVTVAASAGFNLPLCVGTVVGGAMFGDNLSFISDTTIAATRTQGVNMKDKFLNNFRIALPAALITLGILIVMAIMAGTPALDDFEYNIWQAIPYFVVLIAALCGINVFLVLGGGIVLFAIVGGATGSLDFASAFSAMGTGTAGMFETMIVTILVASISALMREYGGFASILAFIKRHFTGKRGGELGCGLLTLLLDIACANNTVAIVVSGPIALRAAEISSPLKPMASRAPAASCRGRLSSPMANALKASLVLSVPWSSRIMRWAIFLPTPGMVEMALTSPAAMCATNSAGLKVESAEMAILGPIPLTAMSFSTASKYS